jgi:hypothetical protein
MQNSPSQVRTGNISPTISGPHKDKDVLVVSGLVVSLAAAIGAFWYFSSTDPRVGDQLDSSTVTEMPANRRRCGRASTGRDPR